MDVSVARSDGARLTTKSELGVASAHGLSHDLILLTTSVLRANDPRK